MDKLLEVLRQGHSEQELQHETELLKEMGLLHEPENDGVTLAAAVASISRVANKVADQDHK